jgi:hypothetical protein
MLFTKVALVTCAFYLGLNVVLEVGFFGLARWKGGVAGIHFTRGGQYIFFGILWLISYSLAWRIVAAPIFARIPR